MKNNHYVMLGVMIFIHFCIMYVLMYAMVDVFGHVYLNINKVYMALLMTAPMAVMEVLMMKKMYTNRASNLAFLTGSVLVFVLAFTFIRSQTGVGDTQFLRSMIPHHSSAILMCEDANIQDQEIIDLCDDIIEAQKREIELMQSMLENK